MCCDIDREGGHDIAKVPSWSRVGSTRGRYSHRDTQHDPATRARRSNSQVSSVYCDFGGLLKTWRSDPIDPKGP